TDRGRKLDVVPALERRDVGGLQRNVGGTELDRLVGEGLDASARADRLVVDLRGGPDPPEPLGPVGGDPPRERGAGRPQRAPPGGARRRNRCCCCCCCRPRRSAPPTTAARPRPAAVRMASSSLLLGFWDLGPRARSAKPAPPSFGTGFRVRLP